MQAASTKHTLEPVNMQGYCPVPLAVNIVVGHYGAGKTNFSLNWAFNLAAQQKQVVLIDFDVVNPYFRSSDYTEGLKQVGVKVIAPNLAGSSLDNPSVSGVVGTVLSDAYKQWQQGNCSFVVIVDVGGDDAGATVLGRFAPEIQQGSYQMLYVVNKYRNLTQTPADALAIMNEIQVKSGLFVTGIVNNSHLRDYTSVSTVAEALEYGHLCAQAANVNFVCTTVPKNAFEQEFCSLRTNNKEMKFYPVLMLVRTPWE